MVTRRGFLRTLLVAPVVAALAPLVCTSTPVVPETLDTSREESWDREYEGGPLVYKIYGVYNLHVDNPRRLGVISAAL